MKHKRGTSLVESVMTLTLFAVAGMAMINLLPSLRLTSSTAEQSAHASSLATSLMERYRAGNLENLSAYPCEVVRAAGTEFFPVVSIDQPNAATQPNLKRIAVTVRWKTRLSERSVRRQVLVCQLPR